MSKAKRVAVVIGSLRKESFSRKIATALIARAPRALACEIVEIGDLALYNEDLDEGAPPAAWSRFRSAIAKADAVLFVTPEYNRSLPGCLKNALDVGSRPEGKSVFDGVPAGVVSVTPYKLGAFGANHALRQTFVFLNMPVMQQPEAYVGNAGDNLDADGKIKNPEVAKLLEKFMGAFERWIAIISTSDKNRDFEAFMRKRNDVARDYANGDASSLEAMVTRVDPATFFSPRGDTQEGAETVLARYTTDAKSFRPGGNSKLDVLQSATSGDLAFWTGLQHVQVRMGASGDETSMSLRITEVFRFEEGGFKLVHRHADQPEKRKGDAKEG